VATFTADEPGEYRVKLEGELIFPDTVNANYSRTANYLVPIVAEGESLNGCSYCGRPAPGWWVVLLAFVLLRRKR
jgi:hypothetical protein